MDKTLREKQGLNIYTDDDDKYEVHMLYHVCEKKWRCHMMNSSSREVIA